ncbi:MAG: phage portal protein [Oscillospiraceae bacterium]|nr:phage portal protein [Oscillospiraceae bacterium]
MTQTRAAINAFARFASKLQPEVFGDAKPELENALKFRPNPWQDTSKFLRRIAAILSVNNTAFIVPIETPSGELTGYYPVLPQMCEIVENAGKQYLRYTFENGSRAAVELEKAGILTDFQYRSEFFGESNLALRPVLDLIQSQNQSIINSIKTSASIRFLAKLVNRTKTTDIIAERDRFAKENLSGLNQSGIIMYDPMFSELTPIEGKPVIINAAQMKSINESVFNYFGVSEKILQNNFSEDEFNAFYDGKIAPFALQLSLVMTNMTFTENEIALGNKIEFSENRLMYASNKTKIDIASQSFDRGLMTINEVMDLWGRPHVPDGDKRFIRKEYTLIGDLGKEGANEEVKKNTP